MAQLPSGGLSCVSLMIWAINEGREGRFDFSNRKRNFPPNVLSKVLKTMGGLTQRTKQEKSSLSVNKLIFPLLSS